MSSHQIFLFFGTQTVSFQPFHTIYRMDFQFLKNRFKFFRQFQHFSLGQSRIFLLQFILFFLQIFPDTIQFFQFPDKSAKYFFFGKKFFFFQIKITQDIFSDFQFLLITLSSFFLLRNLFFFMYFFCSYILQTAFLFSQSFLIFFKGSLFFRSFPNLLLQFPLKFFL